MGAHELAVEKGWLGVEAALALLDARPEDTVADLTRRISEGELQRGKKHGRWRELWPNGKTRSEANYVDGKLEGTLRRWGRSGKLELVASYRLGQRHGEYVEYFENGNAALRGTFVDDLLVYRLASDHYLLVINAGEIPKKYKWIADQTRDVGDVAVVNSSSRYALLAVQGPAAAGIVQQLTTVDLASIKYYWFAHGEVAGVRSIISRTGYTGEDGFELFVPPASAERVWNAMLQTGADAGIVPVGLGARDTLRLEAGMHLSGQDIDETTTVLEADLGWIVGWKKTDFIGKAALTQQKAAGVTRKLVGFEMLSPGIARHGYKAFTASGDGVVTSGTHTPHLKKAIGFAYLPVAATPLETAFEIDIRGRRVPARVVPRQFYKRSRS